MFESYQRGSEFLHLTTFDEFTEQLHPLEEKIICESLAIKFDWMPDVVEPNVGTRESRISSICISSRVFLHLGLTNHKPFCKHNIPIMMMRVSLPLLAAKSAAAGGWVNPTITTWELPWFHPPIEWVANTKVCMLLF
jgi:hypothetical protein